jgi:hypothetical protein
MKKSPYQNGLESVFSERRSHTAHALRQNIQITNHASPNKLPPGGAVVFEEHSHKLNITGFNPCASFIIHRIDTINNINCPELPEKTAQVPATRDMLPLPANQ